MKDQQPVYHIDRSGDILKSVVIWKAIGSVSSPIAYISKPKSVTKEEFDKFLDSIKIYIKQ